MGKQEDGTVEQAISNSEEDSLKQQIISDTIGDAQDKITLYSILEAEYSISRFEEQMTDSKEDSSKNKKSIEDWNKPSDPKKNFIDNNRKKFESVLETILYEGVIDVLKDSQGRIMLPKETKESVEFLVGLGDAGKIYRKELKQLMNGKTIPGDALNYISLMIQRIFSRENGMALDIQSYINMKGLLQTKDMIEKMKEFSSVFGLIAAITDISAYIEINKKIDECKEIMNDVLKEWYSDDKELPQYDSWIRPKFRIKDHDENPYSIKFWKQDVHDTSNDVPDSLDD